MLQSCIAKYNHLETFISEASDELLLEANRLVEIKSLLTIFQIVAFLMLSLRKKMQMEKYYQQIDESNMQDLLETFQKRHEEALNKKTKVEMAASMIETSPEFIPKTVAEIVSLHKRFAKSAKNAGLPSFGSREYKNAICVCIKNLLTLATPELVDDNLFTLAPSLSAAEVNSKLSKILLLYHLALPSIRQHIVYT